MDHNECRKIRKALLSFYHKEAALPLIRCLHRHGVELLASGGTHEYIIQQGMPATQVETLTGYPAMLGGRVKTLHPLVFGGILARRDMAGDMEDVEAHSMPVIDLVAVELYPFVQYLQQGAAEEELIEKIDIGGVALLRAAAKNHRDVLVVPGQEHHDAVINMLDAGNGATCLEDRRKLAAAALLETSNYDNRIFQHLDLGRSQVFSRHISQATPLRYGENPHQQGVYYGDLSTWFRQVAGKPLSYNNLLDVAAAMELIDAFQDPAFVIIKHTNPCGVAERDTLEEAWESALAGDPVSAFGGILACNRPVGSALAEALHPLFFEVLIAPAFQEEALDLLTEKSNRILLQRRAARLPDAEFRSLLDGVLWQTRDEAPTGPDDWKVAGRCHPKPGEWPDLAFANTLVKHLKSNAIALVKDRMLIGMGCGQTSRVDALKQAIEKARTQNHSLSGAVMASDAFFPFSDCVEMAHQAGITAVIQPGGSKRDRDSIAFCDQASMAMVFTGLRHFKH